MANTPEPPQERAYAERVGMDAPEIVGHVNLAGVAMNTGAPMSKPPIDSRLAELQGLCEMIHPQLDALLEKLNAVMAPAPPSPCGPESPGDPGASEYCGRIGMAISDMHRLQAKISDATNRLEL